MGGSEQLPGMDGEDSQINFHLSILQGIRAYLHLIDRELRIRWTNAGSKKFGRGDSTEIKGKHCYEIYLGRTSPCSDCPVRRVFESCKAHITEKRILLPGGSQKCFEVRVYPIYDRNRKIAYVIKMGLDVTDRKLAAEKHSRYVDLLETSVKERTGQIKASRSANPIGMFGLSQREIQILRLMSEGFSNNEISQSLVISPHTVKTHVTHIFDKIGVTDRTQASVLAARLGII